MSSSTLVDTIPAKLRGWNNEGGIYVYKISLDVIDTYLQIRAAPTGGRRHVIIGWNHSMSVDHTITFDLGAYEVSSNIVANAPYGIPLGSQAIYMGEADTALQVKTSNITLTALCFLTEASHFYLT
jgi:hypothetical protein